MKKAKGYEYYKAFSLYLTPSNRNAINGSIIEKNVDDLNHHLNRLVGTEGGKFRKSKENWVWSKLPALKKDLKAIDKEFEKHQKYQLQIGGAPVTELPPELQIKNEELEAQIQVTKDEIKWVEQKLEEARTQNKVTDIPPIEHRSMWGTSVLKNGVMINVGGMLTKLNDEGILFISDKRSDFEGMLVHEFRSKITNPMGHEFRLRQRLETKSAIDEKRDRKRVGYPQPPIYDKKTKEVTYPGYSKRTVKKYTT
jgi:hypothetical protein